ncbi:MAG TPA: DNA polymerase [Methanosarcina sp.]|jgi:hypothetical protein
MEYKEAFCRGYIETEERRKKGSKFCGFYQDSLKTSYPRLLVLDTETTTDCYQNLEVGYFEILENGELQENGFFYVPMPEKHAVINTRFTNLQNSLMQIPPSYKEIKILKEYAEEKNIPLYSTSEFIANIFLPECYGKETPCIGYNLPFDLSRIAGKAENTVKGDPRKGDILLSFPEFPTVPNIKIRRMGLAESISFSQAKCEEEMIDKKGRKRKIVVNNTDEKKKGYFFDCSHLVSVLFGSGTQHFTLKEACKMLKTEHQKLEVEKHGEITKEYLTYLQGDVKATYDVYVKVEEAIKNIGLKDLPFNRIYSGASIGKALFKQMGIKPFLDLNPEYPSDSLGRIMEAFYAGRVECKLRHEIKPSEVLDFTSMYPSVIVLIGLWDYMISNCYVEKEATEEIKEFVDSITLEKMQDPSIWKKMPAIVKVKPDNDILPLRTGYDENTEKTVGLENLSSDKCIWFTLCDVVASKLLTGKTPEILMAYKYEPGTKQNGLKSTKILGYKINPRKDNLIKFFVEERQKIKKEMKLLDEDSSEYSEKDGKQLGLKILSNALGYGIFVELNTQETEKELIVCRGEEKFTSFGRSEKEGKFFNPLIGTTITAASRLMLAIAEAKVKELGYSHYYMDTDSIFVPPEIAEEVSNFFNPLNPYENVSELLKIEDKFKGRVKDEETGLRTPQQFFLGISSKRYVVFARDENGVPDITRMEGKLHGLGHISNIFQIETEENKKWHPIMWRDIILYHEGILDETDIISKYGNKFEISKIGIRTPTVLYWFNQINSGKPYEERIKPYNFFLRGNSPNKDIMPIAPMSDNFQDMVNNPFIDAKTGEIKEGTEYFNRMDKTFFDYYNHPEAKFTGKRGLLKRREIFITGIKAIGKEIDQVKQFEELPEAEEDDVQVFEKLENLTEKVEIAWEKARRRGDVRNSDLSKIKKEIETYKTGLEKPTIKWVEESLKTLKRARKHLRGNYHLPTEKEKEIILGLSVKEVGKLGIPEQSLMDVKSKVRKNESLNLNCIVPAILVNYCKDILSVN